jgi:hypothetical protein
MVSFYGVSVLLLWGLRQDIMKEACVKENLLSSLLPGSKEKMVEQDSITSSRACP